MLKNVKVRIGNILAESKEYRKAENNLIDNLGIRDNESIDLLVKLQDIVIQEAYMEGYRTGIEDTVKRQVKDNPGQWLKLNQVAELI